jgi:hypothetical protein
MGRVMVWAVERMWSPDVKDINYTGGREVCGCVMVCGRSGWRRCVPHTRKQAKCGLSSYAIEFKYPAIFCVRACVCVCVCARLSHLPWLEVVVSVAPAAGRF